MYEIARDFSFLNQGFDLNIEFSHQINNFPGDESTWLHNIDTISKMVEQNEWPFDVMLCDIYLYNAVAQKVGDPDWGSKYLMDFKDEKWFKDSHKDIIYKTNTYTNGYNGIAPGAYIESFWELLYVSGLNEAKLGLDVKRTNMTMDDFIAYAKAVYEYNINRDDNDKVTFLWEQRGLDGYNYMLTFWVVSWLEKEKADSQEQAFELLKKVYTKFEEASQYRPLEQHTKAKDEWDLKADKILFTYHSTWVNNMWKKRFSEGYKHMRMCEFPSPEGRVAPAYPGNYNPVFAIPKASKNKDAAIRLMKQISTIDVAEKWMKITNSQTGLKSRLGYSDFDNSESSKFFHFIKEKYNNVLIAYNLSHVLFGATYNINFYPREVLLGEMTAKEALDSVKKQVEGQQ